jgi:hypothetical protein
MQYIGSSISLFEVHIMFGFESEVPALFFIETAVLLSDNLVKLGEKQLNVIESKTGDEQKIIITTEFDNVEHFKTIYDLCQTIIQDQVICTIDD